MSDTKSLCQRLDDVRKTRATAFQNLTFSHSSSTGRLPRSSGLSDTKSHTTTECKSWAPLHWPEGRLFWSFRCLNWVHWDLFFIHYFFLVTLGGTVNLLYVHHRDCSKTPSVREWIVSYRKRAAKISTSSGKPTNGTASCERRNVTIAGQFRHQLKNLRDDALGTCTEDQQQQGSGDHLRFRFHLLTS